MFLSDPPVIILERSEYSAVIGESVCFEAAVTGTPTPLVEWKCDDLSIDEDFLENVEGNKYKLKMLNTAIIARGTYTLKITAENEDGIDMKDIKLKLRGKYHYLKINF